MSVTGDEETTGRDTEAGGETPDHAARSLYERFLPPEPFRGIDPALYAMRRDAGPADTVTAWHAAQRWALTDQDAAHAMRNAEAHLRSLSPDAMAVYDEQRAAGATPALAMAVAHVELQTQVVMALLDELEVEAAERGLRGLERDAWVERQVEDLTDLDIGLPAPGRAAVTIAGEYRSLVAAAPADEVITNLGQEPEPPWGRVMTPDEAAAYMAEHPDFARRVEEHGRKVAEEYGPRLAGGPAPAQTEPGAVEPTAPASTAREEVGGLLGYILSNGAAPALSPDGEDPADDGSVEPGDGVRAAGTPAAADIDDRGDAAGPEGPSLDW
jgi:hypothetical protein